MATQLSFKVIRNCCITKYGCGQCIEPASNDGLVPPIRRRVVQASGITSVENATMIRNSWRKFDPIIVAEHHTGD